MPVDHSGKVLIRVLKSSTSSTVHSHQDLAFDLSVDLSPSIFRAAQFKNLGRNHLVLAVIYHCLNSMIITKVSRTPALEFMQINKSSQACEPTAHGRVSRNGLLMRMRFALQFKNIFQKI